MNLARSSLKLFIANVLSTGIGFVGIVYFARELGATQMGIFFLFQAMLGILSIPADFGLRGAVEKRISEGDSEGAFLSSAIVLKSIPVSGIVIVILLARPYINGYIGSAVSILLAVAILIQEAAQLSLFVLKGELRVGETAILRIIKQLTWVVVGMSLIRFGMEAEALIYGFLAGLTIVGIWGWKKSSVTPVTPTASHVRSLFEYGKYNLISSIGGYFYNWMDVAIIGLFLTQAHVGAYEIAWRVTAVTLLFSNAVASTIFPQVSRWETNAAIQRVEKMIREAITPTTFFVIPAFFGVLVFSKEILRLGFGSEYTIASAALIILAGERILYSIHLILGRSLQGINRPDLAAKATIVSIAFNLVLNVVLIHQFGIAGAAAATFLSFSVNTLLHGFYLSKILTVEFPYSEVGWCVLSSSMMALVLFGLQSVISANTLPRLLSFIAFGAVVYGILIVLYQPIRQTIVMNLKEIIPRYN